MFFKRFVKPSAPSPFHILNVHSLTLKFMKDAKNALVSPPRKEVENEKRMAIAKLFKLHVSEKNRSINFTIA